MTALFVALGAAVGAPTRYLVDLLVQSQHHTKLPWGTMTVNAVGSVVLGLLTGGLTASGADPAATALVGTGFCGALTTFSTFSFETTQLVQGRRGLEAVANVVISVVVGVLAFFGGDALALAVGT